jgi:hypothetical protein
VRVVFVDTRPEKSMFFNTFRVETVGGCRLMYFALRNDAQVILDDFVRSMADQDVAAAKASMEKYAGSLGLPSGDIDVYRLPRPAPERRIVRNVRIMHAANVDGLGEVSLYEFSVWQASNKARPGASEDAVQAIPTAVLACPLDVMKALFLEVFQ